MGDHDMSISDKFSSLVKVMTRGGAGTAQQITTVAPHAPTTIVTPAEPDTSPLAAASSTSDIEIQALRQKADALEGSKPVGIDGFKFFLMRWGAALLPIFAAIAVGDVIAQFFLSLGFNAFSAYTLSFVLELVTMLLTYAISHALTYRAGRGINIPALLLTIVLWLLFLAGQAVLLIAIGGTHPGTFLFVAIALRAVETALCCTSAAVVAYWTRGKSFEEELATLQRKEQAFMALHAQYLERQRNEQQAANHQRQAEQHLAQLERNSEMLAQIGDRMSQAALKVFDRLNDALDQMTSTKRDDGRGW
jgi:hypothetical protein